MKARNDLRKLYRNKTIKFFLIPVVLLFSWLVLSVFQSSYNSFTILEYPHYQNKKNNFVERRLFEGEKITGEFEAYEDNLGILSMRFEEILKVDFENQDIIIFRIKEKGQTGWIEENRYRSGSFTNNEFFPFGFSPQKNSKEKVYVYEISSLRGDAYNSLVVKNGNPLFISKYKLSKDLIFRNDNSFFTFSVKKIITFLFNINALLNSVIFLLPLIFYLIWIMPFVENWVESNWRKMGRKLFAASVVMIIVGDIFLSDYFIPGFMLGSLGLWVIAIMLNKFQNKETFILAFIIIMLSVLGIFFKLSISVDKCAAFVYFLLIIGFIQCIIEYKHSRNK